jgi:hypothetical protein
MVVALGFANRVLELIGREVYRLNPDITWVETSSAVSKGVEILDYFVRLENAIRDALERFPRSTFDPSLAENAMFPLIFGRAARIDPLKDCDFRGSNVKFETGLKRQVANGKRRR